MLKCAVLKHLSTTTETDRIWLQSGARIGSGLCNLAPYDGDLGIDCRRAVSKPGQQLLTECLDELLLIAPDLMQVQFIGFQREQLGNPVLVKTKIGGDRQALAHVV